LIDEADTFLSDNEDLRGILNAGHKRGGQVIRCVGDDAEPRAFGVFAPAAIAAIGNLPGTIEDRAIPVRMKRATRAERPEPLRTAAEAEGAEFARRCARWVSDHNSQLRDADPAMPANLFNRVADNWRPLFAIAEAVGSDWTSRLTKAAEALTSDDTDAEGRGARLLADVRAIFMQCAADGSDPDKISPATLCSALAADPSSPWADFRNGKALSQAQLARLLRPFGIAPHTVRIGDETPKGYEFKSFEEAWSRYLEEPIEPPPPSNGAESTKGDFQTATPPQSAWEAGFSDFQSATQVDHVAERKHGKPACGAGCGGVADRKPILYEKTNGAGVEPSLDEIVL
jgi:putative DNA primase/helicase